MALSTGHIQAMQTIVGLIENLMGRAFPCRCELCDAPCDSIDLCCECAQDLPRNDKACYRCGQVLAAAVDACGRCLSSPPPFVQTIAPYRYEFPADQLIIGLKFRHRLNCANAMAELIVRHDRRAFRSIDALIPVPLHYRRQIHRGFNQAEEICRNIAQRTGLPWYSNILTRTRATAEQSSLAKVARTSNVAGAFTSRPVPPHHTCIGLVDDVITTGATIRNAAWQLAEAGASEVRAIAFARAN